MKFKAKGPMTSLKAPSGRVYCFSGTAYTKVADQKDAEFFLGHPALKSEGQLFVKAAPVKAALPDDHQVEEAKAPVEEKPKPKPAKPVVVAAEPEEPKVEPEEPKEEETPEPEEKPVISRKKKKRKRGD